MTRVADEKAERPAAAAVDRDAHAGVRVGHSRRGRAVLEAEAEAGRIGLGSAGPGDVDVELVRILVVRDVEVGTAVAVDVEEGRAQTVREVRRLEAGRDSDLTEARAAVWAVPLVQVEEVADADEVGGEPVQRVRHGVVRARVTGDEHVGAAVAVHVGNRDAGVPAGRVHAGGAPTLGEGAVAVVPEELDPVRRRNDQVGPPVAVEVGRGAAVALHPEPGVSPRGDVVESAVNVLEQLRARQPAVLLPRRRVVARVRVDGEQVLPTVAVVVEPADSAAHHRRVVVRDPVAERVLAEVEAHRRGDVLQPDAAQRRAHGRRLGLDGRRLARRREAPTARPGSAAGGR